MTDDNNVINKDVSMDGNVKANNDNVDNPFVGNKPDNVSMSDDDVDALNADQLDAQMDVKKYFDS